MNLQKAIVCRIISMIVALPIAIYCINISCASSKPKLEPQQPKANNTQSSQKSIDNELSLAQLNESGQIFYKQQKFREAVKPLLTVATLDSTNEYGNIWLKIAHCYSELGIADSAQMSREKGLVLDPDNIYLHRKVASYYAKQNMPEEAIKHFEKVVKLAPQWLESWKELAHLYAERHTEQAIQAFDIVTVLDPNDQAARIKLTELYNQTGNVSTALEFLEREKLQNPNDLASLFKLGRYYFLHAEYLKAESIFRDYLKLSPKEEIISEYLTACFQNQGRYETAINVYSSILKLNSGHQKSLCEIASCLKSLKKFERACEYTFKAEDTDPSYGYTYIIRGEIYEATIKDCMAKRDRINPDRDDKLIYQLAYDQYLKAGEDIVFQDIAKQKMKQIANLTPSKEDRFMYHDQTKAKLSCYQWIY